MRVAHIVNWLAQMSAWVLVGTIFGIAPRWAVWCLALPLPFGLALYVGVPNGKGRSLSWQWSSMPWPFLHGSFAAVALSGLAVLIFLLAVLGFCALVALLNVISFTQILCKRGPQSHS